MSARATLLALPLLLLGCAPPIQVPEPLPPPEQVTPQQWAAGCTEWDEWDKPAPPFRIHGSTYYVGTCGISAILIAGAGGHILIDSGTEAGARVVLENVGKLGFRPNEIATILYSHEHFDHVGGHAAIKAASGAHVVSSPEAAEVFRTGRDNPDDPQFGLNDPMQPVSVDVVVRDGETVRTESAEVHAVATPGHTPGALSWRWQSCDDAGDCRTLVYADSMSPIANATYRFSDRPAYLAAYRAGIAQIAALDCDILLTPHPSASGMVRRAATGTLAGGTSCTDYAAAIAARLDARLAEEAGG